MSTVVYAVIAVCGGTATAHSVPAGSKRGYRLEGYPLRPLEVRGFPAHATTDEILDALDALGIEPTEVRRRRKDASGWVRHDFVVLTPEQLNQLATFLASTTAPCCT